MSTDKNLEDILKVANKLRLLFPKFSSALIASTRGVQKFLEDGVSTVDEEDDQLILYEKELAINYFLQGDAEKLIDQMEELRSIGEKRYSKSKPTKFNAMIKQEDSRSNMLQKLIEVREKSSIKMYHK